MKKAQTMHLFHCALLCFLVSLTVASKKNDADRLYGSRDAIDGQFPYAAFHLVRTSRGVGTCSASLLTQRWVLLAAHCVNQHAEDPTRHLVVAGKANLNDYLNVRLRTSFQIPLSDSMFDLQERRAAEVYYHVNYTRLSNNDVALIRVSRPFELNRNVGVISLARAPFPGEMICTIVGYGVVEGNQRKHIQQFITNMPARAAALCRYQRTRDLICLADTSRGICHGDSGGPIVCQGTQRGVASHGLYRGSSTCGSGTVEQYFTDTQLNLQWIDAVMRPTPVKKTRSQRESMSSVFNSSKMYL